MVSSEGLDVLDGEWYTEELDLNVKLQASEIRLITTPPLILPALESIRRGDVWGENVVGRRIGFRSQRRGRFSRAEVFSYDIRSGLHRVVFANGKGMYPDQVDLNAAFGEGRLRLAEASSVLSHLSPCRKAAEIDAFGYDRPIK